MKTDIEIAQEAVMQPIKEVAASYGIGEDDLELYGKYKAKLSDELWEKVKGRPDGKLVLVTAINPTPAGEGKTTITVGLGEALGKMGKNAIIALREPSLGPCFGIKGGAAGGGYAQVLPMEDLNLHFTGDFHAITSANNLLAALLDNHIQQGNALGIDPRQILWKRCLDMNDRVLRNVVVGLGAKADGMVREDHFVITVASEIMAILCLANDMEDLKDRLGKIIVAYNFAGEPVTAADLHAVGSMAALLKDALKPNMIQTLEHTGALVHGGPFANIAHGCNSVRATKTALKLCDIVVTEAGFGADLGAEKFMDIKCRKAGIHPDAVVLVATVRALKYNGGVPKDQLSEENLDALKRGIVNLEKHIENIQKFGVPVVVSDTPANFLLQNFLTWQPNVKPVTYYSPEFLTYYAVQECRVKLHAYFTDESATIVSQSDLVLADLTKGKAYTIPLQYASVVGKLGDKMPAYYDVWVEDAEGIRLSYVQRYYASDMKSETEQWVLFENSLGGIDTFRAYGSTAFTGEHTHNIAEIDDISLEYRVDTARKFQKDTGYLNKKERTWLLDFFPSLKKYLYTGAYIRSIIVVESNVTYTDKELPSNYTFTYKFADAKPFLNLQRSDTPTDALEIVVPEVGSFTVPPRLIEFPRLPLSEGALFPVQDPYSEGWSVTTTGSVSDYIINRVSENYDGGGGVGHQHNNIDLLQLLSYATEYLLVSGKRIKAGYADKAKLAEDLAIDSTVYDKLLSKVNPDKAAELITFLKGLISEELIEANNGLVVRKTEAVEPMLMSLLSEEFEDGIVEENEDVFIEEMHIATSGAVTLGELDNVTDEADKISDTDDLLVRLAGASGWTINTTLFSQVSQLMSKVFPFTMTLSGGGTYEKGSSLTINLSWTYDRDIESQSINNESLLIGIRAKQYVNVATDTTYTLKAIQGGQAYTKSVSAQFKVKKYYGVSANGTLTNDEILALSSTWAGRTQGSTVFDCTGGKYPYYILPTSMVTGIQFWIGGLRNTDWKEETREVTNAFGYKESYTIYRLNSIQTGVLNIEVK